MSSVPQLFATPLPEAWDELFSLAPQSCDTTIESRALDSIKRFHPEPVLYTPSKKAEKGYNDKSHEKNLHYGLLVGRALSIINQYHHVKREPLSDDQLVELVMEYYPLALEELNLNSTMTTPYEARMDGVKASTLTHWGFAEQQCRNAVQSARGHWREDVYLEIQRRAREQGARGGRAYSTYTLEDHLATAHMTAAETSAALGLNIRTVYRMKKRYAHIDPSTGEVHGEEQETTEAATGDGAVEPDRVRSETRNDSRPHADELAPALPHRRSGSHSHAPLAPGMDDQASGILRELDGMPLPF